MKPWQVFLPIKMPQANKFCKELFDYCFELRSESEFMYFKPFTNEPLKP